MTGVAFVSGGGGGIGAALCRSLAHEYLVIAAGRNRERLDETVAAVAAEGRVAHAVELDVTDAARTAAVLDEVQASHGPIECLVGNAGVAISAPIGAPQGEDHLRRHLEVNFLGAVRPLEHLAPVWKAAGQGTAVFIASSAALMGYPYVSAYAASKHALLGYARSASQELRRAGIGVHAICPHYVDSPMTDQSVARIVATTGRSAEEARELLAAQNPGGRLVTPDEVAAATMQVVRSNRTGIVLELPGGDPLVREPGQPLE